MNRKAALSLAVSLAAAACHKADPAPPVPAAAPAEPPASAPAGPEVSTAAYRASLKTSPCRAGESCTATVELDVAGEYHVNEQYPYKWKPCDPPAPGVRYAKAQFGREDGKFEAKRARIPVTFVADKPGDVKVCGTFSLSVCSAANCLMDKQSLETTAKVE